MVLLDDVERDRDIGRRGLDVEGDLLLGYAMPFSKKGPPFLAGLLLWGGEPPLSEAGEPAFCQSFSSS
ncbi:hypothetical protein, partial [Vannielia sp.]|uniref:hypothetical protein n=1 Tax=Vannielia sp. TaxID=2813045 RepID=UPI0026171580